MQQTLKRVLEVERTVAAVAYASSESVAADQQPEPGEEEEAVEPEAVHAEKVPMIHSAGAPFLAKHIMVSAGTAHVAAAPAKIELRSVSRLLSTVLQGLLAVLLFFGVGIWHRCRHTGDGDPGDRDPRRRRLGAGRCSGCGAAEEADRADKAAEARLGGR